MSAEPDALPTLTTARTTSWLRRLLLLVIFASICAIGSWHLWHQLTLPPRDFPTATSFTINPGAGLQTVAAELHQAGYIRSRWRFYILMTTEFDPRTIKAGAYTFTTPASMYQIGQRITAGGERTDLIRVTFIEGERVSQFAERASAVLPEFDTDAFVALATPYEGQLFPDTYLIPPDFTAPDLIELLRSTYTQRLAPLQDKIANHQLAEAGIITLASIVEREANTPESKRLVAGILLDRMTIGMPLQADASIEYVLDKPLSQLTPADLEIDSPYNTYLNRGLPPTPIGNPGLTAIEAVLEPTPSDYLFYITGNDGNFYYARTYEEHQRNIARYLR